MSQNATLAEEPFSQNNKLFQGMVQNPFMFPGTVPQDIPMTNFSAMDGPENIPDIFQEDHTRLRAQKAFKSSDWGDKFIKYERLKAHLDSMLSIEDHLSKEFTKSCELFWCILKADIDTVSTFYSKKEQEFLQCFQEFKFDSFTHSTKMNDKDVLCLFATMLHELNPEQYYVVSQMHDIDECCQRNESLVDIADSELRSNFERFFSLCIGLDTLRKYVVLNYLTIHRVLAQFDKITNKNSLSAYIPDLISESFYSSMTLAQLLVRTECVTASLMAQHTMKPPCKENYVCAVCNELLVSPVVLSCAHRMCLNCLGMIHDERTVVNAIDNTKNWSRCTVCQKQQNLDPEDHRVDGVLKHFLKSHFGEPNAPKFPKPKKRKNGLQQGPILDIAFPDGGIRSSFSSEFRPVPASKYRPDINSMGMYPQMSLKRKYGRFKGMKRFSTKRSLRKSKKQQFQSDVQAMLTRTACSKGEAYAYSQADMKPASCHQCKSNKLPIHLLFCSSKKKTKGQRNCHKKFCDLCLQRYSCTDDVIEKMTEQRQFKAGSRDTFIWQCPACIDVCSCAGCKRRRAGPSEGDADRKNAANQNLKPCMTDISSNCLVNPLLENTKYNELQNYAGMLSTMQMQPDAVKDIANSILAHRNGLQNHTQSSNSQLIAMEEPRNGQEQSDIINGMIRQPADFQDQVSFNGLRNELTNNVVHGIVPIEDIAHDTFVEKSSALLSVMANVSDGDSENTKPANNGPAQHEIETKITEMSSHEKCGTGNDSTLKS